MAEAAIAGASCAVEDCLSPAHSAGYCSKHYQRKCKYGDPLTPATVTKACEFCGARISGRRTKRFCGWLCQNRSKGAQPREAILAKAACRQTHVCGHCRNAFQPKRAGHTAFCSRACAFAHKAANAAPAEVLAVRQRARADAARKKFEPVVCRACGCTFTPRSARHYHCSEACRPKRNHDAPRMEPCIDCGVDRLVAKWGHRRCTSCTAKRHAVTRAKQVEKSKVSGVKAARRKARKLKVRGVSVETVNPLTVLSRDGWRCQLCGITTPRRLRGTFDDSAPEVDHIVPIAQGGEHSYRNTQCACRKCNINKGAKIIGQMRLFA